MVGNNADRSEGINSTIGHYRGKHDAINSIAAGGLSGMLFKSTRGTRPMLISGGLVATVAGTWAVSRVLYVLKAKADFSTVRKKNSVRLNHDRPPN